MAAAQRSAAQQRLTQMLGPTSEYYLRKLAETDRSLTRQIRELLQLVRDYGPEPVAAALEKAHAARAFGADYIANILRQQQSLTWGEAALVTLSRDKVCWSSSLLVRGSAALAPQRSRVERTGYRSALTARLRHIHSPFSKGIP